MPVNFLTPEQRERYRRFNGAPSPTQLARYFHLDDRDLQLINRLRRDHTRLGFAVQLCTVRFLGTFLSNPLDVPEECVSYLAAQLNIQNTSVFSQYLSREALQWEHAGEIQQIYGYRDFTSQPEHFQMTRWLFTRSWLGAERPIVLFDLATAWMAQHRVLLPGATVLEREVARIHERANHRLWRLLSALPNRQQRRNLLQLVRIPDGQRFSRLELLRRAPTHISSRVLRRAVERLQDVRALGIHSIDLSHLPASRVKALAQYASSAWAQTIENMRAQRRLATLLAFAHTRVSTGYAGNGTRQYTRSSKDA